jgi:hypothetical protein
LKTAIAFLQSISDYSQSKHYSEESVPKKDKELPGDYERRTWRERCHVRADGHLFIPPMCFTNSLKEAAKYLSLPIPGKSRQSFTKHFEAGVMVLEGLTLKETKDNVKGEWLFVPSDGRRGGGRRVERCFPLIPEWSGVVEYKMLDDIITKDVFLQVLEASGTLIGIGRFRPKNLGYYGRFKVNKLEWIDK